MKKTALIFGIVFLLSFLVIPAVTNPSLSETEHTYKPRDARGVYSFGNYLGGAGQINLVNGNLTYGRQIVSRPGRAGFNLNLSIYYNSKIWERDGGDTIVKYPGSPVGVGWYLGFARLMEGVSSYAIIFPDGSSHELKLYEGKVWKSLDSTYILFDPLTKTATLKGGTKLVFGNKAGGISYMTEMKDTNGNIITATYLPQTGLLDEVYDTLGKAAEFHYDNGYLDYVISHGTARATIYFNTSEAYQPLPAFAAPAVMPFNERQLDSITISLPNQDITQEYSYDYFGELSSIKNRIVSGEREAESNLADFKYDTFRFADRVYREVEERAVISKTEYGSVGQPFIWNIDYTFTGNTSNPSRTSVSDVRGITEYRFNTSTYPARSWKDGLLASVQRKNPEGTFIYRSEATEWEQDYPKELQIVNPRPSAKILTLDDDQSLKTEYEYTNDDTGNIRSIVQYPYNNSKKALRSVTVRYLHENNPAYRKADRFNLISSVAIEDNSGNGSEKKASRTEYGYDEWALMGYPEEVFNHDPAYNNANITVRGNQTSVRNWLIDDNRYLLSRVNYDTTGNVISTTDPKGNTTTRSFSAETNRALPEAVVNALGHGIYAEWQKYGDSYNGDLASITDANGAQTSYWYDQLGRKVLEITPFDANMMGYDDIAYLTAQITSNGTAYTVTDPLGNPIQTIQPKPSGGGYLIQNIGYDNPWRQPSSVSLPYTEGSSAATAIITYDALGRKVAEYIPNSGMVIYEYSGNTTTVKDTEGRKKKYVYNEFGSVAELYEEDANGNLSILTKYSYNALGRLTKIAQGNQTRSFTYDSLGRLLTETFPESGTSRYTYDDNGNVLTRTDARGVKVSSQYDELNRRTRTSFSDGTPAAAYVYDEMGNDLIGIIANGTGRMTSAWTSDGTGYSWTYDIGGRPLRQNAFIDGEEYLLDFNFWEDGCGCGEKDLQSIIYPDGYRVNYGRDEISRIMSIYGNDAIYAEYVYNSPFGGLSDVIFGDGYIQRFRFDAYGVLKSSMLESDDSGIEWDYSYDDRQRITRIGERVYRENPLSDESAQYTYEYDHLGRLSSATHGIYDGVGYVTNQINSFTYDQYGNMLTSAMTYPLDTGSNWQNTYNVDAGTNRLKNYKTGMGTASILYDAAGNILQEGAQKYAYDGAGRLINAGTDAGIYKYDAFGRRVKKTYVFENEEETAYGTQISVYGPGNMLMADYVKEPGESGTTRHLTMDYVLGGEAIAKRVVSETYYEDGQVNVSSTTKYLHRNHLSQVIDPYEYDINTGAESMHGQPFASGGDDQFQGHKDDPESGLHYNIARSYNPMIARWTTPDPLHGNAYVPQSLNKYAYNMNDPVNLVDKGGKCSSYPPAFFGTMWFDWSFDLNYMFFYESLMNSGYNSEEAQAMLSGYGDMCGGYYYELMEYYGYPYDYEYYLYYGGGSGNGGGGGEYASGGGGNSGNTVITITQERINSAINLTFKQACLNFLNNVITNLADNVPSLASIMNISNLRQGIQYATYINGTTSTDVLSNGQTVKQYLASKPDILAFVNQGSPNNVYINSSLTSYSNKDSVLIHESFHLAISFSGWEGGLGVTDAQLAVAAGITNSTNPSLDFQNKISNNCK